MDYHVAYSLKKSPFVHRPISGVSQTDGFTVVLLNTH